VARRKQQVLVHVVGDHQRRVQTHLLELLRKKFRLWRLHAEALHQLEPLFPRELRQDRAHSGAIHLAIHFLREVLVRQIRENLAAPAPQRARNVAGTGTACALLPPGLLVRVADVAAPLLRAGAAAGVRLIGDDYLMHQRFVELASEQCVGGGHGRRTFALLVDELELHHAPLAAGAGAALAAGAEAALAAGAGVALADRAAAGAGFEGAAFGEGRLTRAALVVGRTPMSRPRPPGTHPVTASTWRSTSRA